MAKTTQFNQQPNGIPIKSEVGGSNFTLYLASVRFLKGQKDAPDLVLMMGDVAKARRRLKRSQLDLNMQNNRLETIITSLPEAGEDGSINDPYADDGAFEEMREKASKVMADVEKAEDATEQATQNYNAAVVKVYEEAMLAAGMPPEHMTKALSGLDVSMYEMIADRLLQGCGCLDFTKRGSS